MHHFTIRRGGRIQIGRRNSADRREQPPSDTTGAEAGFVDPNVDDVIAVKTLLKRAGSLPDELINMILDEAEYWPCSSAAVDYTSDKYLSISSGQDNRFLLRTEPLGMAAWAPDDDEAWRQPSAPRKLETEYSHEELERFRDKRLPSTLTNPCRKIVFYFRSNDQGWGGNPADRGTYNGSWTWFDAGLERFEAPGPGHSSGGDSSSSSEKEKGPEIPVAALRPLWPPVMEDEDGPPFYHHELLPSRDHKIQCNKTATRQVQDHRVEWRYLDDIDPESEAAKELDAVGRGKGTGSGEFVRNLRFGDVVTVWGRARFGGWENRVQKAEVKAYWAV